MTLVERFISILAPHNCLICGEEGKLVCNWCAPDICPPVPSRCYKCYSATDNSRVCVRCRRKTKLSHVWVRTDYDGHAKKLVRVLKFERARAAAPIIANLAKETLPYLPGAVIVPIPTATSRIRLRGYDHAKLITRGISRTSKLPSLPLLARIGQTRQVGTKRAERTKQLLGAFLPTTPNLIKNAHIILVDDVVTTGATLEEAARVLKQAGAKTVDAIVFAQKQ